MTPTRRAFLGSILGAVALASPFGLRCRRTELEPVTTVEEFLGSAVRVTVRIQALDGATFRNWIALAE